MTELIICAIIVILAIAVSLYQLRNGADHGSDSAYFENWWWTLPM